MSSKRWLRALGLLCASALAADQLLQWTLLRDGYLGGRRIAPFDPPLFDAWQTQKLAELRTREGAAQQAPLLDFDAELGWCSGRDSADGIYTFDWAGARIGEVALERQLAPGRERVVAVGDSFTFGLEVGARETWIAALQRARPGLEIANLGVCGFDLEQSLLRWRRDGAPLQPRELWVGFVPSQVLRNVTLYVPAWRHWTPILAFKPRAEIDSGGTLRSIPCPVRSLAELVETVDDQGRFLDAVGAHDRWVRASPSAYAPSGSSWLQHSASARILLTLLEHGGRSPEDELGHPRSEIVELFSAQFRALAAELAQGSVRLRILVLPDRADLGALRRSGRAYWESLCTRLAAEGHDVIDVARGLLEAGVDREDSGWAAGGHYSASTQAVVAGLLEARLR